MLQFRRSSLILPVILAAVVLIGVGTGNAALRKTVASGNWSDSRVWDSAIPPVDGDDVLITAGTDVNLDVPSPRLVNLVLDGTLHGGNTALRISAGLTGNGKWVPETGTVIYIGPAYQALTPLTQSHYYNLTLADSTETNGPRVLTGSFTVDNDLVALFGSDTATISGSGSLNVAGNFIYVGGSPTAWTGSLTFFSIDSAATHDTSFVSFHRGLSPLLALQLPHIIIAKSDSALVRLGTRNGAIDTLAIANSADTIVSIQRGGFDLQTGWITLAEPLTTSRPFIDVESKGRLRIAAPLPVLHGVSADPLFDSLHTPLLVLDSGSTVEYYSMGSSVIDASYLTNNIVGRAYQNLVIGARAIASAWANPLTIRGDFRIAFGATFIPYNVKNGVAGNAEQVITLFGNVRNEAPGPNGASGFYGGIHSSGTDRWTFKSDRSASGKDTLSWSGPSQLGTVDIAPNVVLSVRHESDSSFDSLDILNTLIEEAPPCGGHLIGTVYSEVPVTFDASHTTDSLHGLGLILTAGSDPAPGKVRVSRTSGYLPPGADPDSHPLLRYYQTYADTGGQRTPNEIQAAFHCDEVPAAGARTLNLWRSQESRGTWYYLGPLGYDSAGFALLWQTPELYPVGTRRPNYWMFAEGYRDTPTPVDILSFRAIRQLDAIGLEWQTASETDVLGFEVERRIGLDSTVIDSWESNDALRAKSASGAFYNTIDRRAPIGSLQYRLYERSIDGIRSLVATRSIEYTPIPEGLTFWENGVLHLSSDLVQDSSAIDIYDILGRHIRSVQPDVAGSVRISLIPGVYLVISRSSGNRRAIIVS